MGEVTMARPIPIAVAITTLIETSSVVVWAQLSVIARNLESCPGRRQTVESELVKGCERIVEDFSSIREYLDRLESKRTLTLSAPAVVFESKPENWTSISLLWISGRT